VAQILKAAWRETRSSVMRGNGVAEFYFRQYLFACQARLLFKLNRPTEVNAAVYSVHVIHRIRFRSSHSVPSFQITPILHVSSAIVT